MEVIAGGSGHITFMAAENNRPGDCWHDYTFLLQLMAQAYNRDCDRLSFPCFASEKAEEVKV